MNLSRTVHILILAIILAGCSSTPEPKRGQLPGSDDDTPDTTYDFTPELQDKSTRFTSPDLTIRYADGGVIATLDNTSSTLSLIDLTTNHRVDLTIPELHEGTVNATLAIDSSVRTDVSGITVERLTSDAIWISITHADDSHSVLVFGKDD